LWVWTCSPSALDREAQDLAVFADRLAGRNRRGGDLVADRHVGAGLDILAGDLRSRQQIGPRDDDVVGRVEANCQRRHGGPSPRKRAGNLQTRGGRGNLAPGEEDRWRDDWTASVRW
jgi:hypothetical protein